MISLANNLTTFTLTYKQRKLLAEILSDICYLSEGDFVGCAESLLKHNEKIMEIDELLKTIDPDENLF